MVSVDLSKLDGNRQGIPYTGSFKIVDVETGEYKEVTVKITVVKSRSVSVMPYYLEMLIQRFPLFARFLNQLDLIEIT